MKQNNFYNKVLSIATLMIAQQLIINLINIIDNIMVGRFNDVMISSVAIVNRIFTVSNSFIVGILAASTIFLAQYNGLNDKTKLQQTYHFTQIALTVLIAPFIIAGLFFPEVLIRLFSDDSQIITQASNYMRLLSLSMIPFIYSSCISNSMRSVGLMRIPLICCIATVFIKIIGNCLFLYQPFAWGLTGAGVALLLCRLSEFVLLYWLMKRNNCSFHAPVIQSKIPRKMCISIGEKMLPIGFNELIYGVGLAMFFKGYASFNTEITAGYSIAMTYYELFRILSGSMGMVMTIIVGKSLGIGNFPQAKKDAGRIYKLALGISVIFAFLLYLCSYTVPFIYTGSEVSIQTAIEMIRRMALLFPLATSHLILYFIFRVGGDSKSILLMDSLFMWVVPIPTLLVLTRFTNLSILQIYMLVECLYILKILLSLYLLKKERWLKNLTLKEKEA